MKYYILNIIIFSSLILLFGCASQMRPVRIIDYQEIIGGKNQQITLEEKDIYYDGTTVYGVPGENEDYVFGVAFKPKDNQSDFEVEYGNSFLVRKEHIEMVEIKEEERANISIHKYFYKKAPFLVCLFSTINQMFGSEENDCYYLSEKLYIVKDENGEWYGNEFGSDFIKGKDIIEKIFVTNNGNKSTVTPFIIIETLPDYLEFKKAIYAENFNIQKITYDVHTIGNKQIIIFKIYPDPKDGFEPENQFELQLILKSHPEKLGI